MTDIRDGDARTIGRLATDGASAVLLASFPYSTQKSVVKGSMCLCHQIPDTLHVLRVNVNSGSNTGLSR